MFDGMIGKDDPFWIKGLAYLLFSILGFLCLVLLGVVVTGSIPYFGGYSKIYAEGEISGVVVDFCKQGRFCKTFEGNLIIGGSSAAGKHSFRFSVPDVAVAPRVEEAVNTGKPVRLHYRQVWWRNAYSADTDFYIEKVEPIVGEKEDRAEVKNSE